MNNPTISIIIPCYNSEKFLAETLECLLKQTIENWEAIIVNDGSEDNSSAIAHEYAAKDKRFKVIDQENAGVSAARNNGIKEAQGKYILPLDADDLIDPTYTEKAVAYLESHPDTKLVYCEAVYFGDRNEKWDLSPYSYDDIIWGNMIFCSAVYRKKDFYDTPGYNPQMKGGNEDWDFWLTFLKKDDKAYRIPETLFFYRQHGNTRNSNASQQMANLNAIMIKNHYERYEPFLGMLIIYKWMADSRKNELERVYNSKTYKVCNFFMYPFRWIKIQMKKR